MALGFVVGLAWWISQRAFSYFLFRYLDSGNTVSIFSTSWFSWAWLAFGLVSSFAYGLTVGFVVAYRARYHHHRFAVIVICLLCALTLFLSVITYSRTIGITKYLSLFNVMIMVISLILNLVGGLNGIYLAQSFKRNRGVRIQ
ncbi:MAG TPA: hypothetical protein VGB77_18575 [Abditibacteriaceae bacterium]